MFGIIKSLFGQPDNNALVSIIREGALLVDVRTPGEFAGGSVRGAINIPVSDLIEQLEKIRGKKSIVVFCRSGNRSSQAKSILEQHGFQNVINGGAWQQVNMAVNK